MIDVLKVTATMGGALIGSGGAWAYLASRQNTKVSPPAAITQSQASLAEMLNEQTQLLLKEAAKDRRDLKRRIDRQGQELSRVRAEVSECNTKHEECEARVSELKTHIDKHLQK